jgi:hypothetical protein
VKPDAICQTDLCELCRDVGDGKSVDDVGHIDDRASTANRNIASEISIVLEPVAAWRTFWRGALT